MSRPPKEGLAWSLAGALSLPAVLSPVYNPDLFWHLSAGRWMLAHAALPRVDFLALGQPGRPWLDFEWLSQLLFYGAYAGLGLWGVWALKAALVVGALFAFSRLLRALEVGSLSRAGACALFSIALLAYADARPDLFSLILLAWLLERLERRALGALACLGAFALWASLHAGFVLGLIALALYAAGAWFSEDLALARTRAGCLLAAAAGACLNPYGLGAYSVVWRHWAEQAELARVVKEWGPLGFDNPLYWPAWALIALLAAAAIYRLARRPAREPAWPLLCFAAYVALATLQHERAVLYLALAGSAALATLAPSDGKASAPLLGALAAFALWLAPRMSWRPPFNPKYVPFGAAAFLESERPAAQAWRAYDQWEWGGYLGFRLSPWYKVSSDGRYLFHEQHAEEQRASADAASWRTYFDKLGYDAAVVPDLATRFPSQRRYPDGSLKAFRRPWYLSYFPRERWALVYWDPQALIFVDRAKAAPEWLAAHEYRWVRPFDEEAFADALKRGEIPLQAAAQEEARHLRELALVPR